VTGAWLGPAAVAGGLPGSDDGSGMEHLGSSWIGSGVEGPVTSEPVQAMCTGRQLVEVPTIEWGATGSQAEALEIEVDGRELGQQLFSMLGERARLSVPQAAGIGRQSFELITHGRGLSGECHHDIEPPLTHLIEHAYLNNPLYW